MTEERLEVEGSALASRMSQNRINYAQVPVVRRLPRSFVIGGQERSGLVRLAIRGWFCLTGAPFCLTRAPFCLTGVPPFCLGPD